MSANVTPWFLKNEKPARVGAYQTRLDEYDESIGFQYWDGKKWGVYGYSAQDAFRCRLAKSQWQRPHWRGLAEKP